MPTAADNAAKLRELIEKYTSLKKEKQLTLVEGKKLDVSAKDQIKKAVKTEFDAKVNASMEVVKKFDEAKAAKLTEALNLIAASQTGTLTAAEQERLQTLTADIQKNELMTLMKGLQVLFDAGVVVKGSLEIAKEYKGKYVEFEAKLTALASFEARVKGDIKLLDIKTLTLIDAKFEASAVAKVSAEAKAKASFKILDIATIDAEATGEIYAQASAEAVGTIIINKDGIELAGKLSCLAEAGAKVKGEISLKDKNGNSLIKLSGEAKATVGAGASIEGKFSLKNGKLTLSFGMGVSLGLGAEATGGIEIDFKAIGLAIWGEAKGFIMSLADKIANFFKKVFAPSASKKVGAFNNFVDQVTKAAGTLLETGDVKEITDLLAGITDATKFVLDVIDKEKIKEVEKVKTQLEVLQNVAKKTFERFNSLVIPRVTTFDAKTSSKYQSFKSKIMESFVFLN